jgi:thiamine biosynthesis lipoprotein
MLMASLGGAACLAAGLGLRGSRSPATVTRRGWALGTDVSITVGGVSQEQADRSLQAAFDELELVEQVMSLYRPNSQVSRLNRFREVAAPHPYLVEVLTAAAQISQQSEGAFDITVQPLWDLYAKSRASGQLPTEAQVEVARQSIDWRGVEVDAGIRLRDPVQSITLNGIAQGFATDRVIAVLRDAGIRQAIINAGEVGNLGQRSGSQPWTAGIQHPRQPDAYSSVIALDDRSLATSGDYATTFTSDFARNHIFDPRTGDSPHELASASILAPTGLEADALSTAAMVLGVDRTMELIRSRDRVDALLILKSGRVLKTRGFPSDSVA